ncbi:hypothetical protein AB9P05_09695 [Roseivirga sp. BDSF3-8]|uniref:hypothetical protein n=1 Tax=Roseivirga sp. BDSF3-8 TaxID=3241598 RepID=UPI0035327341
MKAALKQYAFHPARIYGGAKNESTDPYRTASVADGGTVGTEPPIRQGGTEEEESTN